MTDDQIDILRRSRRSCSVAEIVSGRPVDSEPTSCMGGGFYGKSVVLQSLAGGSPGHPLTEEARAALGRMKS